MRLAALDLGSNSFHLLVAETERTGELSQVCSQKEVLALGSVVQEQGQLNEAAFQQALSTVSRLAQVAHDHGAEKVVAVATSALRDARNGSAFCEACHDKLGVSVELLSGEEEARLAYLGARSSRATTGRVLVADIGGGSVELAVGDSATCDAVLSLPLGFLRLARAFPNTEPGSGRRLMRYVQLECEKARWQLGRFDSVLLAGGTARALGKLIDGNASTSTLLQLCEDVARARVAELLALGVEAPRAAALPAGAAVIAGMLAGLGPRELRIAARGLREGVLLRELASRATRAA